MAWRLKAKLVRWFNSWLICTNIRRILACTPSKKCDATLVLNGYLDKNKTWSLPSDDVFFPGLSYNNRKLHLLCSALQTCASDPHRVVFSDMNLFLFPDTKTKWQQKWFWVYNQKCSVLFGNIFQSLHIQYFYVHILFCFLRMGGKWT